MPKRSILIVLALLSLNVCFGGTNRKPRWPLPKTDRNPSSSNKVRLNDYRTYVKSLNEKELREFASDAKIDLGSWGINTERIIVKFKDSETEQEVLQSLNFKTPLKKLKTINAQILRVPSVKGTTEVLAHLGALKELEGVQYAYPDVKIRIVKAANDEEFHRQWPLSNSGAMTDAGKGLLDADIDAPEAWEVTTGSRDVVVGVVDTGIDYEHLDLVSNLWRNPGETGTDSSGNDKSTNGVDDDANGFVDDFRGWDFVGNDNAPYDEHGHGTHTAGTIGASGNNARGVSGVAWEVSLVPLQIFDSSGAGEVSVAMAAIEYATMMRFPIINNSWGWSGEPVEALEELIKAYRDAGGLFVAAAGNNGADNDSEPFFPANYQVENVISVAATDNKDRLASFSNYGKNTVHLAAPGVDVFSTYYYGSYTYESGTSMAAPHVAGAAALIKSINSSFSYSQIKSKLIESVDEIITPMFQGKTISGGRLNVARAVNGVPSPLPYRLSLASSYPKVGPPSGQTRLTLRGTGFHEGSRVSIGLKPCGPLQIVSQLEMSCLTSTSAILGLHNVKVTNPDGATATITGGFRYFHAPTLSSIIPSAGPLEGGNTLTVNGTRFGVGTKVKVGEKNCLTVRVLSPSQLTCILPASDRGDYLVRVINQYDQESSEQVQYTYRTAPQVTSINPLRGVNSGGGNLTVHGNEFVSGATVKLGSQTCETPNWTSSQQMACIVPALTPGKYRVEVTNPEGQRDAVSSIFYEVIEPKWVGTRGGSCVTVCNNLGLISKPSPEGAYCSSGEVVPASSRGVLSFVYGCRPNRRCIAQGQVNGATQAGQFCYGPSQVRNRQTTDITMGCFCGV